MITTGYDYKDVNDLKVSENCFMFFTEVIDDIYLNIVYLKFK